MKFEVQLTEITTYTKASYSSDLFIEAIEISPLWLNLKSSNLDWPELKKHSTSHSFIITLRTKLWRFPNSDQSKLLEFSYRKPLYSGHLSTAMASIERFHTNGISSHFFQFTGYREKPSGAPFIRILCLRTTDIFLWLRICKLDLSKPKATGSSHNYSSQVLGRGPKNFGFSLAEWIISHVTLVSKSYLGCLKVSYEMLRSLSQALNQSFDYCIFEVFLWLFSAVSYCCGTLL